MDLVVRLFCGDLLYLWDGFWFLCHCGTSGAGIQLRHGRPTWELARRCGILGAVVQTGAAIWQHVDSSVLILCRLFAFSTCVVLAGLVQCQEVIRQQAEEQLVSRLFAHLLLHL